MRIQPLWAVALAASLVACGKQPPAEEPAVAAPADAPAAATEPMPARPEFDTVFLDHMHVHADQMDELMFALADGNLDEARKPAAWLSRHDAADRIPDDWQPYLAAMRNAAQAVETAPDLETARAAAEQISVHCQECHAAAGIITTE